MMLLAETARAEKLFDWLATQATRLSKGSSSRLFLLIYRVGIVVTAFLSNDATSVVLTPAVAAAVKAAKVHKPLPYLLICAFIANAASFVLPISNPANLVIYGNQLPALLQWLPQYFFPSLVAIVVTFNALRFTQRKNLQQKIETSLTVAPLSSGEKTVLAGIGVTAAVLLTASALDIQLGLPTVVSGILTSAIVITRAGKNPWTIVKGVSWSVLPLVAGLFVLVEALNKTGVIQLLTTVLRQSTEHSVAQTTWAVSATSAMACNLANNLPAGLIAGNVLQAAHSREIIRSAVLIGVDLGPNLSVSGSLATILWMVALRRGGLEVSAWRFLKLGIIIMTIALFFTIASLWI